MAELDTAFAQASARLHREKEEADELEGKMMQLQEALDAVTQKLVSGDYVLQAADLRAQLGALQTEELSLQDKLMAKRQEVVKCRQKLRALVLDPEAAGLVPRGSGGGDMSLSVAPDPAKSSAMLKSLMSTTMFGSTAGGIRSSAMTSMMGASGSGNGGGDDSSVTQQWKISAKDLIYDKNSKPIGSGAFGDVFEGKYKGKLVAIKRLTVQQYDDATLSEFEREVAVMAKLRHPNVLLFIGACTSPGNLAMCTQLMSRGSVKDLLQQPDHSLAPVTRYSFMRDTALGMAYLHGLAPTPVLHLDLKTANLLVDEDYHVSVSDFGLAQVRNKAEGKAGSPLYMAPEMLLDREYDTKADVYSFAICMWEIAAEREPYDGKFKEFTQVADAVAKRGDRPELFKDLDAEHGKAISRGQSTDALRRSNKDLQALAAVPSKLIALIQACWNPTPKNRPTFADMVGDQSRRRSHATRPTVFAEIQAAHVISKTNEHMRNMWQKSFGDSTEVPWRDFLSVFSKTVGFSAHADENDDIGIACLKVLCVVPTGRSGRPEEVSISDFGKICEWLGPITSGMGQPFMRNMESLLRTKGFHGFVETPDAEKIMGGKKAGTYLIRFSTRDPGCYAVTVLTKSGTVRHYRIWHKAGAKYILGTSEHNQLDELLRAHRKDLYLKYPQSGGTFDNMFQSFDRKLVTAGYMDSDQ